MPRAGARHIPGQSGHRFQNYWPPIPDWVASLERAFAFFRGVTAQVVPDNLKSGVIKACFHDPEINRTHADLAALWPQRDHSGPR